MLENFQNLIEKGLRNLGERLLVTQNFNRFTMHLRSTLRQLKIIQTQQPLSNHALARRFRQMPNPLRKIVQRRQFQLSTW